ncbi:hypothetical protein GCM10027038_47540 [Arthrobacter bambusae]
MPRLRDECLFPNQGLNASMVTAGTKRAIRNCGYVTDFAGTAPTAAHDCTAGNKSRANTFADRHNQKLGMLAARPIEPFGYSEGVDIVLHQDRNMEFPAQNRSKRYLPPAQEA